MEIAENDRKQKLSFRFVPTHREIENSKKIEKKFRKLKKIQLWLLFKQNLVGKGREREKIKIIVSFCSYPMRNIKFQTNSKKIQKIRRIPFWLYLKQK